MTEWISNSAGIGTYHAAQIGAFQVTVVEQDGLYDYHLSAGDCTFIGGCNIEFEDVEQAKSHCLWRTQEFLSEQAQIAEEAAKASNSTQEASSGDDSRT